MIDPTPFDARFRNPCSLILSGGSMAGKSTMTLRLLQNIDSHFVNPLCKKNILYFYKTWTDSYEEFSKKNIVRSWRSHLPTSQELIDSCLPYKEEGSVVVLDDWGLDLDKATTELFQVRISFLSTQPF